MYYVAHRLFAAHDRALAAQLAQRLASKTTSENVFLPFCDTDEEDLITEMKGRRLFELDRERLEALTAMVAVLHGPSLDDGVCMEMGYAHALGVPVVVVTTDFQTYSLGPTGPLLNFPDPIVEVAATHIVRVSRLGAVTVAGAPASRFAGFRDRNDSQVDQALDATVQRLLDLPDRHSKTPAFRGAGDRTVFVEQSPYLTSRNELTGLPAPLDHTIHVPTRFGAPDPLAAARDDLARAQEASVLVADVSGPETPPGAALLIGAAAARGIRIAAYQPRLTLTHAHGREPNWRNLMIQYAVSAQVSSREALDDWLRS
ncbi:nucleoside 2-deoxyribosyltransferase [Streptomyces scopuliridis]|uniref:nucleoside 2-deoxyribosyltransferase n=1 Tax=Streptomyces scopuliridis TaxID=452529 RepID=UPI0036B0EB7A